MVHIGAEPVLLCKSNTHLDWPGAPYLEAMIDLLVKDVQPRLILSIGTAGGAKPQDLFKQPAIYASQSLGCAWWHAHVRPVRARPARGWAGQVCAAD